MDKIKLVNHLKKKHAVISLWDETKKLADLEKKTPVIALCEKYRKGFWIIVHSDDLDALDIDPTQFFNMKRGNPFNEGTD
jgi:methenyltetrahydromethanopterin cyclohydrolase